MHFNDISTEKGGGCAKKKKDMMNGVKQPTFDNIMVKQTFDNIFTSYDHC